MRITEADYMLAQRRAARLEEIAAHGKPVSFRTALHKSKKIYSRKRLKKSDAFLLFARTTKSQQTAVAVRRPIILLIL